MNLNFKKELETSIFDSRFHFELYKEESSNFKIININSPGTVYKAGFLVPTYCYNNKGLSHTLEHCKYFLIDL